MVYQRKGPLLLSTLKILMTAELAFFGDQHYPLHDKKKKNIMKSALLARQDLKSIGKNSLKTRAYRILTDIWKSGLPQVFIICAITVLPSRLGTIKSETYVKELSEWWQSSDHPSALEHLLTEFESILPEKSKTSKLSLLIS